MMQARINKLDKNSQNIIESAYYISSLSIMFEELIHNAVEARANIIDIHINLKTYHFKVIDNGWGVPKDTVKYLMNENTNKTFINYLSILSDLKIISFDKTDSNYYEYDFKEKKMNVCQTTYNQRSTIIKITNMYRKIPIRRKHSMNSIEKILTMLHYIYIQYPHLKLTVYNETNKQVLFNTISVQSSRQALAKLYRPLEKQLDSLMPIRQENALVSVQGYLSKFELTHVSKHYQHLLVNNRRVYNANILNWVEKFYQKHWRILGEQNHPGIHQRRKYAIFIISVRTKLPYSIDRIEDIAQIRFSHHETLHNMFQEIFDSFLQKYYPNILLHKSIKFGKPEENKGSSVRNLQINKLSPHHLKSWNMTIPILTPIPTIKRFAASLNKQPARFVSTTINTVNQLNKQQCGLTKLKSITIKRDQLNRMRIIGQLQNKFILTIVDNIIIAIDQHAADERCRVEQLQEKYITNKGVNLEIHEYKSFWNATKEEINYVQFNKWKLEAWNFYVDINLEEQIIKTYKLPVIADTKFTPEDCREYINQLISYEEGTPKSFHRILNYKACRNAIMFGDKLTFDQQTILINQLKQCKSPFICAHGRPSLLPLVHLIYNN